MQVMDSSLPTKYGEEVARVVEDSLDGVPILAWGVAGSNLYGLDTEFSDLDIRVITESLEDRSNSQVKHDGLGIDVVVSSFTRFAGEVQKGDHYSIDFLTGRSIDIDDTSYLAPSFCNLYVRGYFDSAYRNHAERTLRAMLSTWCLDDKAGRANIKALKVACRTAAVLRKLDCNPNMRDAHLSGKWKDAYCIWFNALCTAPKDYGILVDTLLEKEVPTCQ